MKTSVTKIMMSFALMGCMIFSASDAMAQGRSRSQGGSSSSRSQSAAVSRSSSSTAPTVSRSSQATPQVNRGSSSMSTGRATVNRSVSGNRSSEVRPSTTTSTRSSSTTTPQVTTRTTPDRSTVGQGTRTGGTRVGTGVTTRGGNNGTTGGSHVGNGTNPRGGNSSTTSGNGTTMNRRSDIGSTRVSTDKGKLDPTDRSTTTVTTRQGDKNRPSSRPGGNNGGKPGGNNGNHGGKPGGDNGKPGGNHGNHGGKPGGSGNNHGYGSHNHYDYSHHPHGNAFHHNYTHHSWSRPLPPPARPHRPAPIIWRRPVIPVGWHPYAGAPVIDRILGLMFGSLYEASLDHLYYNGYYIDGYADNVIYLRDVSMLNLYWPDVMLSYEYGRLANAQFIYHSSYYDRVRFDRVYNSLCRIYGSPVFDDGMTVSWYGGNSTGWVTLTMTDSYGDYYTTMSIGY